MSQNLDLGVRLDLAAMLSQRAATNDPKSRISSREIAREEAREYDKLRNSAERASMDLYDSQATFADPEHRELLRKKQRADYALDVFLRNLISKKRPGK
ncbi:MAG TPA: hypothetical protein VLK22_01185 [Candidatus Udaeobacter sp.]|nr:hypothetical protein [Candidatus Udaeobacter sp.]